MLHFKRILFISVCVHTPHAEDNILGVDPLLPWIPGLEYFYRMSHLSNLMLPFLGNYEDLKY